MGIQGLNPLLKQHAPQAFGEIRLDQLQGHRVAVDAYNWIHATYPRAKKIVAYNTDVTQHDINEEDVFKEWLILFFDFIKKWVNHSIIPIFVFDGEYPMEKTKTRLSRRESERKTKEKMLALKEKVQNADPLSITRHMIDELRKRISNTRSITYTSIQKLKNILKELGIPYIQAKYEGEQLCSMLALEEIVSAVFSTDTDNLAYGAPLLITRFSGYEWDDGTLKWKAKCVWYENILKQLNYSREKFVDLCILGGCDYNTNMKRIAIKTAYKLLNEYHSIDNFPSKYDITCLKHEKCREMFRKVSSDEIFVEGYIDYQYDKIVALRSYLEMIGIFDQYYYLETLFTQLKIDDTFVLPSPPKLPIIKRCLNVTLIIMST